MKAQHVQYVFLATTAIAAVFGVIQMNAKKKAVTAIQTATDLATLQKLYPTGK